MNDTLVTTLISAGGYLLSLLLGVIIFFIKREVSHLDAGRLSADAKIAQFEAKITALELTQRDKWEKHAEKNAEDANRLDMRREQLSDSIQQVRTELLEHCADASDKYLTKDEFISSTTYLTKKTDEVARLLQSVESILARR